MKHVFDSTKLNIFTKVPDNHDFNISSFNVNGPEENFTMMVRNKCIESWKEIPNADIHVFTSQDIRDTFPGMLENDIFYQLTVNTNIKEPIPIYVVDNDCYKPSENQYTKYVLPNKECGFSTDILRYKMMKEIPNAIYMDSDIFIYDKNKFINFYYDNINKYPTFFNSTQGMFINEKYKTDFISIILNEYNNFHNTYRHAVVFDGCIFDYAIRKNKIEDITILNDNCSDFIVHLTSGKNLYHVKSILNIESIIRKSKTINDINILYINKFIDLFSNIDDSIEDIMNVYKKANNLNIKNNIFLINGPQFTPDYDQEIKSRDTVNVIDKEHVFFYNISNAVGIYNNDDKNMFIKIKNVLKRIYNIDISNFNIHTY